jgi:hypothetical protein
VSAAITTIVTQEVLRFGEPIVLIGPPEAVAGFVSVHNPQNTQIKLKRLRIKPSQAQLSNTCEPEIIDVRVSAKICPGETQQIPIRLQLPPGTPPGCYDACLEVGDQRPCPVTIHVLERRRLELLPANASHGTQPGATFTVRTHVHNLGNVEVVLPRGVVVELHAGGRGLPYHFHSAARGHGAEGYHAFLNAFTKGLARDEAPLGRAKLTAGAGPLAPRATRLLEIQVSLPKKLKTDRRYLGILRFGQAVLSLTLFISAAPQPIPSPPR